MNPYPIRVVLADDHALFRAGMKSLLSEFADIDIVAESGDGEELIETIDGLAQPPDICLLDIRMPKMNGYDTMSFIAKRWPSVGVIVLSVFNHDYAIADMLRRGAKAFLQKDGNLTELHRSIIAVHESGCYFDNLVGANFNRFKEIAKLTAKETEFLKLCCADKRYEEIAELMNISYHTATGYRNSLFQKLDVHSKAGLIIFATQTGLY